MVNQASDVDTSCYRLRGWRRPYVWLGRLAYWLTIPGQWLLLSIRTRSYVFLEYDQQVLLVRNWFGRGEWSLPGGGVERGEDNDHAAQREIYEELGFAVKSGQLKPLTDGFAKRLIGGKKFVVFHLRLAHRPTLRPKKSELVELSWMPFAEFKKYAPLNYEVKRALKARSDISRKKR